MGGYLSLNSVSLCPQYHLIDQLMAVGDHGSNVRAVITTTRDGGEKWEVTVLSRRIGEYTTVQRHVISLVSGSDCTVEECVIPRPPDFPPSGLRVCFQVICR